MIGVYTTLALHMLLTHEDLIDSINAHLPSSDGGAERQKTATSDGVHAQRELIGETIFYLPPRIVNRCIDHYSMHVPKRRTTAQLRQR
jgi:hypothetical protein